MGRAVSLLFFLLPPLCCFAQTEVAPEGDKLLIILLVLLLLPLAFFLFKRMKLKGAKKWRPDFNFKNKLRVELIKNRSTRPDYLTLKVTNGGRQDIDLEAPVLCFRKLWSKRKFKLKGINRTQIYPLYLEKGKTHELGIDLRVFHEHDRKLKKYYWAKVNLADTRGRKYSTKYVTLRKSLFS